MDKKGILFVDDEPNLLAGIRRMLRVIRHDYDLFFAESGPAALQIMEAESINVVVSDMRMPGMDGAELLRAVQERYPQAVRIMLTGQADDASVIRTVSIVHQFLAKPCDPETLKEVLIRAAALHDIMSNAQLKEIITSIGALPSLPSVYSKLQKALNTPDVTADDVAAIIEQDIAMTAKLLQLVNSSFFGLFQKVESASRAVTLLGLDTIKILVLGVKIFAEIQVDNSIFPLDLLWQHSMIVAQCSKKIAQDAAQDVTVVSNAFISGMLHDIGRLLLMSQMAESYMPLIHSAQERDLQLMELEKQHYSATHGDIGAYLTGLWGFTGDIVEAVAFHNNLSGYPANSFTSAMAVHVADCFCHEFFPDGSIGAPPKLDITYLQRLGYAEKIETWSELCQTFIEAQHDN
jgi:HD-like signal output (HDOD) protein